MRTSTNESARIHWALAHLQAEIRRLLTSKMGPEDAAPHLVSIAHIIFLLCAYFGRGPERVLVKSIFRVDIRSIARRLGVPTSPMLVREATEALHLLREHAISFGCWGAPKSVAPPLACPSLEEDWMRWAPAYMRKIDAHGADHPWT
jgi:hypothetical protein